MSTSYKRNGMTTLPKLSHWDTPTNRKAIHETFDAWFVAYCTGKQLDAAVLAERLLQLTHAAERRRTAS